MAEIYIKVETDSQEFGIEFGDMLKFHLEEKARNGRANSELIERIKSITGERPAVISGHRSRRKKLKTSLDKEEFMERLSENG